MSKAFTIGQMKLTGAVKGAGESALPAFPVLKHRCPAGGPGAYCGTVYDRWLGGLKFHDGISITRARTIARDSPNPTPFHMHLQTSLQLAALQAGSGKQNMVQVSSQPSARGQLRNHTRNNR